MSVAGSVPFILAGTVLLGGDERWAAAVLLLVGGAVVVVGVHLSVVSREPAPDVGVEERTLEVWRPSVVPAFARIVVSLALFVVAAVLYSGSDVPYVYPFMFFAGASYEYFRGVVRYWENRHTVYQLTDQRIVEKYCLASLRTTEVGLADVRAVSAVTSLLERATGRGSVIVGGKDGVEEMRIREVDEPGLVEDALRRAVGGG